MCQSTASCSYWLGSAGFPPPDQFRLPAALWLQPDTISNFLSLRAQLRSAEAARLAGGTSKGWSVPVMLPSEQASIWGLWCVVVGLCDTGRTTNSRLIPRCSLQQTSHFYPSAWPHMSTGYSLIPSAWPHMGPSHLPLLLLLAP